METTETISKTLIHSTYQVRSDAIREILTIQAEQQLIIDDDQWHQRPKAYREKAIETVSSAAINAMELAAEQYVNDFDPTDWSE